MNDVETQQRFVSRYTSRMLGGVHRPPQPNYIALACRAIAEVIRIDQRLRPFVAEQQHMLEQDARMQEREAALHKVYGPDLADAPRRPSVFEAAPLDPAEVLKQEQALAKSRLLIARLQAKLQRR